MKDKKGTPKWRYRWINGRSRNEIVKLSPDELSAMSDEIQSMRDWKNQDHYDRRKEYVQKCREKAK